MEMSMRRLRGEIEGSWDEMRDDKRPFDHSSFEKNCSSDQLERPTNPQTCLHVEKAQCYRLVICGVIAMLLSKSRFNGQTTALRFAAAIFGVSLCLCIIALVMLFWLADTHDAMAFCIFNSDRRTCACRPDRRIDKTGGWHIYSNVSSCRVLDQLFRLMIITMVVHAASAFFCALGLIFVYSLSMHLSRLISLRSSSADAVRRRDPMAHANDWDSWLQSSANCHRLFTAMRNGWFPPSYDASQRQARRDARRPSRPHRQTDRIFAMSVDPPPPYVTPPPSRHSADAVTETSMTLPVDDTEKQVQTVEHVTSVHIT